ncbi:MAG: LacI family transcriptional regulator, partial [Candidatus Marinimicrobia bacterium]|nr:LacI family transcriptional regulator [Candidatus Neomarinimicrobiota bacterium]
AIRPETRQRVQALARKYRYRPNHQARNLRLRKTHCVAMILPELRNTLYAEKLDLVSHLCRQEGYEVAFSCTRWDTRTEQEICLHFLAQQVDAVIFACVSSRSLDFIQPFLEEGKPVCVIGRVPELLPGLTVITPRQEEGYYAATRHLLDLGHRHLGLVGISMKKELHPQRIAGIRRGLAEAHLGMDEVISIPSDGDHLDSGFAAVNRFIEVAGREALPSALLAVNDHVAVGAMAALDAHGARVPDDVSVVGCDDVELSRFARPPLTTISQETASVSRLAAKLVLEQLRKGQPETQHVATDMVLKVRRSTGPTPEHMNHG